MRRNRRAIAFLLSFILMLGSVAPVCAEEYTAEPEKTAEAADPAEETAGITTPDGLSDEPENPVEQPETAGDEQQPETAEEDPSSEAEAEVSDDDPGVPADDGEETDDHAEDPGDAVEEISSEETGELSPKSAEDLEAGQKAGLPSKITRGGTVYHFTGEYSFRNGKSHPLYESDFSEPVSYEEAGGTYFVNGAGFSVYSAEKREKDYYYLMYNQLDDSSKQVYKVLKENYARFMDPDATAELILDEYIEKDNATRFRQVVFEAFSALDLDDMQMFWVNKNAVSFSNSELIEADTGVKKTRIRIRRSKLKAKDNVNDKYPSMIEPVYEDWAAVQAEMEQMAATRETIESDAGSQYEFYDKIRVINDYIIDRNYYNRYVSRGKKDDAPADKLRKAYLPSSALTEQEWLTSSTDMGDPTSPVCEGYARAFKMICDDLDIPCILVCGKEEGSSAGHMWNYVQNRDIGIWYAVDTTWNDPPRSNEYTVRETPEKDRRNYLLVGSETADSNYPNKTFLEKHPANSSLWSDGTPFEVPTLSEGLLGENQRVILFDANGGTTGWDFLFVSSGEPFEALPTAVRPYCIFLGWFTDRKGGEKVTKDMICVNSTKFYAHWEIIPIIAPPAASFPDGAELEPGTRVTLTSDTAGAVIRYTLDGSSPAEEDNPSVMIYTDGIVVDRSMSIRAVACKDDCKNSEVAAYSYIVNEWGDAESLDAEELASAGVSSSDAIPAGLWSAGAHDTEYTGKAVTFPELKVFYGRKLLSPKDYTVRYSNNKNAGKAEITITGKGNYTGKETAYFTIRPIDLSSAEAAVIAPDVITYANGRVQKEITPVSCIVDGSRVNLKNNTDFRLEYGVVTTDASGNVTVTEPENGAYTVPGNYTVTIIGNAPNFTGMASFTETILENSQGPVAIKQVSKLRISVSGVTMDGGGMAVPQVSVSDGANKLTKGVHYDVKFDGNNKAGTGYAFIIGIEESGYVGTAVKKFQIKGRPIGKSIVSGISASGYTYTGAPFTVADISGFRISDTVADENGVQTEKALVLGVDYKISYKNNGKKGKATIICKGIGIYTGTIKKTVKIMACDLAGAQEGRISVDEILPVAYQKDGAKPAVVVRDGAKVLSNGVDYKLSYENNSSVGTENGASVIITGKGNYSGTISQKFTVKPASITKVKASVADIVYTGRTMKKDPVVTLTDTNGKKLKAGIDYSGNIRFEFVANGKEFDGKRDILAVGTEVQAIITGKGNYVGDDSQDPDRKIVTFRCIAADISKATVKVEGQSYTGRAIHPTQKDVNEIYMGKGLRRQALDPADYEIIGYGTNVKKGKGTMVIRGLGNYGGTKTVTFPIRARLIQYIFSKLT